MSVRSRSMLLPSSFLGYLLGCSLLLVSCAGEVDPIERAAAEGDWSTLSELCAIGDGKTPAQVRQTLLGHAYLALNRNNESIGHLLAANEDSVRVVWLDWTTRLVRRHGSSAVAHYLRADALARNWEWDAAMSELDRALAKDDKLALARNARGVLATRGGNQQAALEDFETACQDEPKLADVHASLGTLMVLRRAKEGATESFASALRIAPGFALALNGRGCARVASGHWEEAHSDFAAAGSLLALPLALDNLRALGVTSERLRLSGMDDSPLFRLSDFMNYQALRDSSLRPGDLFRVFLHDRPLPKELDARVITRVNGFLADPAFADVASTRLDLSTAPARLRDLLHPHTGLQTSGAAGPADLSTRVILCNRLLLERAYPELIADHTRRMPGHQLTVRGLMNQHDYKAQLSTYRLSMGQARMDYLYRPVQQGLSRLPGVGGLFGPWGDHLAQSTRTNLLELQRRGVPETVARPGGVLIDYDYRSAYIDRGDWPVQSIFGLAYLER